MNVNKNRGRCWSACAWQLELRRARATMAMTVCPVKYWSRHWKRYYIQHGDPYNRFYFAIHFKKLMIFNKFTIMAYIRFIVTVSWCCNTARPLTSVSNCTSDVTLSLKIWFVHLAIASPRSQLQFRSTKCCSCRHFIMLKNPIVFAWI